MEIGKNWKTIRRVFQETLSSSVHYSVATVNPDGSPHVTPIGALFLRGDRTGFFFDIFTRNMSANLERDPRISVLAVISSVAFWQKSMLLGRCDVPPSVRLTGTAGKKRKPKPGELARWRKHVAFAKGMRGYDLLWKDMDWVRDITFDGFEPVYMGEMTRKAWK
ncbi:MAG: pyridoxamine 5'-phosphate oxidase family protein [Desulfobacteraceae bacterium]|nr:MAG: pyridoxamine 5'-phosphate oxidase family protein [Desulfobacteraceae bacterium]